MISHPHYPVEPWQLRETDLDLDVLAQSESLFTLSNGHIGWRGNLDEGEPHGVPGSYLNGFYETRALPYAEAGYGYPEDGQSVVNVTNGKLIRLLVNDEPLDLRYGRLHEHERVLDFRTGLLRRTLEWESPGGALVRVRTTRLVSFTQRAVAVVRYEVEAVGDPVSVVLQSELVANEPLPDGDGDPRESAALTDPLICEQRGSTDTGGWMLHRTARSGLRLAAAMDHRIDGPPSAQVTTDTDGDVSRVSITADLEPGEPLRVTKLVSYGWSAVRSQPAVVDQVFAALTAATQTGWEQLVADQGAYLDDYWDRADVEVEGDAELQQAVRFAQFHLLQAAARAERRAIPAKGLTGPGYDGHAFWDTETYVLPVLTYTAPYAVADALCWRHSTLPLALERAGQLGLAGAVFPWRTIAGQECSGYWPAGTAEFHVGADIADAVVRYVAATGDSEFEAETGLELLVQTARLWAQLGHYDSSGGFRIDGVTGPDEYSAVADNNVFTNLMASHNLTSAAEAAQRHPDRAGQLGVDAAERAAWRKAAEAVVIPYDEDLGVHPQSEGFTSHQVWDFAGTSQEQYPLLSHFPYFDLYRKQVVKQPDLVLALHLRGEAFTAEQKARDFEYYEALTVRDSSLSACTQSVMAAETGHLDLAADYLAEAARMDLDDLEHNTRDGLHMASLAGTWIALVSGLAGLRRRDDSVALRPRLPAGLTGLAFTIAIRGRRLKVRIKAAQTSYLLLDGEPLTLWHEEAAIELSADEPVTVANTPVPRPERTPTQPHGRAPTRASTRQLAQHEPAEDE